MRTFQGHGNYNSAAISICYRQKIKRQVATQDISLGNQNFWRKPVHSAYCDDFAVFFVISHSRCVIYLEKVSTDCHYNLQTRNFDLVVATQMFIHERIGKNKCEASLQSSRYWILFTSEKNTYSNLMLCRIGIKFILFCFFLTLNVKEELVGETSCGQV